MSEAKYKRILLKLSGEALAGDSKKGIDPNVIGEICDEIKKVKQLGVEIALVVGGEAEMEKKWNELHLTTWECLQLL